MSKDILTEIASKSLGDSTSYAVYTDHFDASLLNPMPRAPAREQWGIKEIPNGFDSWTCHEATFLLDNGLPISGTLKFVYDSRSEMMVESKSAKLYLNSFDMCRMGPTHAAAISNYENQVKADLEAILQTEVSVRFFSSDMWTSSGRFNPIKNYENLVGVNGISQSILERNGVFDDYHGQRDHIEAVNLGTPVSQGWYTNILRSRCRHTKQKDTGLAAIAYSGTTIISPVSLLQQIVSLREVNEFHEFCAERLFDTIRKHMGQGDTLSVMLLYSRRGSLDINPVRYNGDPGPEVEMLRENKYLPEKVQGQ